MNSSQSLTALQNIDNDLDTLNTNISNVDTNISTINTNISNVNTNISTINDNIVDIGITLAPKKREVWGLVRSGVQEVDTDATIDGNRWYYKRNQTGNTAFVKSLNVSYITTGITFAHDTLFDCSNTNAQFRTGTSSNTSSQDWFIELPTNTELFPYLHDNRTINGNDFYSFKIPLNFEITDDDYIVHKVVGTFSDSGMVAMSYQAEVEYTE